MPIPGVNLNSNVPPEQPSDKPPPRNPLDDLRSAALVVGHLMNDSTHRQAILKDLDLPSNALAPCILSALSRGLRAPLESKLSDDYYEWPNHKDYSALRESTSSAPGLMVSNLSTARDGPINWFWKNKFPAGCLCMIIGDPGSGKSFVLKDISARVTTGRDFPDADNPWTKWPANKRARKVLWISAEDSDHIVKYRIKLLGGDPLMIDTCSKVRDPDGTVRYLNLRTDLPLLQDFLVVNPLIEMICIDPVTSFLGRIDPHKNNEVRSALGPLDDLMDKLQIVCIGINHLNKMSDQKVMYRALGSIAFTAGPRANWSITKDPHNKGRRLFTEVKNNYAPPQPGLAFKISGDGLTWESEPIPMDAEEAMAGESTLPQTALQEAMDWLREILKSGEPVPAKDIWAQVEEEKLCKNTVRTASVRLKVRKERIGGSKGHSVWSIPH